MVLTLSFCLLTGDPFFRLTPSWKDGSKWCTFHRVADYLRGPCGYLGVMQGWLRPQGGVRQGAVGGQQERPSCKCPQHHPCRRPLYLDHAGPHAGDLAPGRWADLQKWRDLMQPYLLCPGAPLPQCSQGWSSSVSNPIPTPDCLSAKHTP